MEKFNELNTDVTEEEFIKLKKKDKIKLRCRVCSKNFEQSKSIILKSFLAGFTSGFCSRTCSNEFKKNQVIITCEECGKTRYTRKFSFDHNKHNFCSYSCGAKYRNKHKNKGYIRSKIELYIEEKIRENFPYIKLLTNDRILLEGLELDYYFPNLKLAIELNGITHYEPIYGLDRLSRSKDSDKRKMILCYEKGVELAVINISQFKYFTEICKNTIWKEVNHLLFGLLEITN